MSFSRKCLSVLATLSILAFGQVASALSVGDANYLGLIDDGIPSGEDDEAAYINALGDLAAGASNTTCAVTEICNRLGSTLAGPFPDAVYAGRFQTGVGSVTLPGTFLYVLAKYGSSGSWVWYSSTGFSGDITVPGDFPGNGGGLSHVTYFNRGTSVPEPGTLALLGLGLMGLGFARRKA